MSLTKKVPIELNSQYWPQSYLYLIQYLISKRGVETLHRRGARVGESSKKKKTRHYPDLFLWQERVYSTYMYTML